MNIAEARPSFDFSNPHRSSYNQAPVTPNESALGHRTSFQDRPFEAIPDPIQQSYKRKYKGRIRTWPGLLLLLGLVGGAVALIVIFTAQSKDLSNKRTNEALSRARDRGRIQDGTEPTDANDPVLPRDDDGIVGNPKVYPPKGCALPDYQSKNGNIYAVASNGTEVAMDIKGINWFGMEGGLQAPFGLWENENNGTNIYEIVSFLSRNKFNSVRLPLSIKNILENKPLLASIINKQTNRALDTSSYLALVQSIVKALGFRQISVLISMHTLTPTSPGFLWYGEGITVDSYLKSIDMVTKALCSDEYFNVIGIDAKNEPASGTWGTGGENDWRLGSQLILNRMLKACPKWLGFIEGVNAQHSIVLDGEKYNYYDWYGGGLHKVRDHPVDLDIKNKIVWAPHYYNPGVYPQYYLYGGGTVGKENAIMNYIELSDDKLADRIQKTMDDMFGYLANDPKSNPIGYAVVLGEFGGLYTNDKHPKKTTQRCTDITIRMIKRKGFVGGYQWSLNPESAYQYNPVDTPGHFIEGLLENDWKTVNKPFLKALQGLDDLAELRPVPCFPIGSTEK